MVRIPTFEIGGILLFFFFNSLLCLHSFNSCLSACLCQDPADRSWCCWLSNWMYYSSKSKRKGSELSGEGSLRWILKPVQELPWRFKSRGCVVFYIVGTSTHARGWRSQPMLLRGSTELRRVAEWDSSSQQSWGCGGHICLWGTLGWVHRKVWNRAVRV